VTNLSKTEPTGIINTLRSLNRSLDNLPTADAVTVNVLRGSTCKATDFVPESLRIEVGKEQVLTTTCGRSSNDYVPFIELNLDDKNGYLFAVGWTGTWKARFANRGKAIDVEIGMERSNFRLLPGETIRQPSITVFVRKNQTRREFRTLLHRFMVDNKVPRDSQGKVIPPLLAVASGGGNKTPQMMADILQYSIRIGSMQAGMARRTRTNCIPTAGRTGRSTWATGGSIRPRIRPATCCQSPTRSTKPG
jgi:hypothetical protein